MNVVFIILIVLASVFVYTFMSVLTVMIYSPILNFKTFDDEPEQILFGIFWPLSLTCLSVFYIGKQYCLLSKSIIEELIDFCKSFTISFGRKK